MFPGAVLICKISEYAIIHRDYVIIWRNDVLIRWDEPMDQKNKIFFFFWSDHTRSSEQREQNQNQCINVTNVHACTIEV